MKASLISTCPSYSLLMSSSPLRSCPSLPHWPRHHVFPISRALSLSLRLSCCAAMRWIDLLAWLQILPPNRHKSSPEREASRMMCCIIKRAVLPEGMTERSERAGEKTERKKSLETYRHKKSKDKLVTVMTGASIGIQVNKEQIDSLGAQKEQVKWGNSVQYPCRQNKWLPTHEKRITDKSQQLK